REVPWGAALDRPPANQLERGGGSGVSDGWVWSSWKGHTRPRPREGARRQSSVGPSRLQPGWGSGPLREIRRARHCRRIVMSNPAAIPRGSVPLLDFLTLSAGAILAQLLGLVAFGYLA